MEGYIHDKILRSENMKRIILSFICIISIFCFSSCGTKEVADDGTDMGMLTERNIDIMGVRYNLYTNGYAEIANILNSFCDLTDTITYEGKEYKVIQLKEPTMGVWDDSIFKDPNGIGVVEAPETFILPDSIISFYTLHGCTSKEIILHDNIQIVGAFSNCQNIETVVFPEGVTDCYPKSMFTNCENLTHVDLPRNCTYHGSTFGMFLGCSALEAITIPGTVKVLWEETFSECEILSEIILEEGIERIERRAFNCLPALETIVLPNSVTELQSGAFYDCSNLKHIYLSDNMTDVPVQLFKQNYGNYDADPSGITFHVKESLVEYVQNLYPTSTVVAKE